VIIVRFAGFAALLQRRRIPADSFAPVGQVKTAGGKTTGFTQFLPLAVVLLYQTLLGFASVF
jgi:hypothetical protein